MKKKTNEKRNPNMGQAQQAKNDSPLHEQCTTILSSNQSMHMCVMYNIY